MYSVGLVLCGAQSVIWTERGQHGTPVELAGAHAGMLSYPEEDRRHGVQHSLCC